MTTSEDWPQPGQSFKCFSNTSSGWTECTITTFKPGSILEPVFFFFLQ